MLNKDTDLRAAALAAQNDKRRQDVETEQQEQTQLHDSAARSLKSVMGQYLGYDLDTEVVEHPKDLNVFDTLNMVTASVSAQAVVNGIRFVVIQGADYGGSDTLYILRDCTNCGQPTLSRFIRSLADVGNELEQKADECAQCRKLKAGILQHFSYDKGAWHSRSSEDILESEPDESLGSALERNGWHTTPTINLGMEHVYTLTIYERPSINEHGFRYLAQYDAGGTTWVRIGIKDFPSLVSLLNEVVPITNMLCEAEREEHASRK